LSISFFVGLSVTMCQHLYERKLEESIKPSRFLLPDDLDPGTGLERSSTTEPKYTVSHALKMRPANSGSTAIWQCSLESRFTIRSPTFGIGARWTWWSWPTQSKFMAQRLLLQDLFIHRICLPRVNDAPSRATTSLPRSQAQSLRLSSACLTPAPRLMLAELCLPTAVCSRCFRHMSSLV